MENDENASNLGQLMVLSTTFTGSSCYMHGYTQDTMIYIRNCGTPDLFVTFTCNSKRQEIQIELSVGQTHSDCHDLLEREFR